MQTAALFFSLALGAAVAAAAAAAAADVIPIPAEIVPGTGSFEVGTGTVIRCGATSSS